MQLIITFIEAIIRVASFLFFLLVMYFIWNTYKLYQIISDIGEKK